jgi:hypothetical protein
MITFKYKISDAFTFRILLRKELNLGILQEDVNNNIPPAEVLLSPSALLTW